VKAYFEIKRPNEAGEKPNWRGWWPSLKNYHETVHNYYFIEARINY
jgi:hypothetical protein